MIQLKLIWTGLTRQQKFGIVSFLFMVNTILALIVYGSLGAISADTLRQPHDPLTDPFRDKSCLHGVGCTYLYQTLVPLAVWVQSQDESGVFISERVATTQETLLYDFQRNSKIEHGAQIASLESLVGDPEQGEKWKIWVDNRTTELLNCESEGAAALALGNWSAMSIGQQNAVMDHVLECGILTAKVERKVLDNLYDLLVAQGLIVVSVP